MPSATTTHQTKRRYKPKGLVLCSGCNVMVEAVCYGMCPKCFRGYEEDVVRDLQTKDPKFKGFQDEKFHLNLQIGGLQDEIRKWEKKLRKLVVSKGNKKALTDQLEKIILQMSGRRVTR